VAERYIQYQHCKNKKGGTNDREKPSPSHPRAVRQDAPL
jgi:hypothetical protein